MSELVVTRLPSWVFVALRPRDQGIPKSFECPLNGEWLAIRFRPGTFLPQIPTASLLDHNQLELPDRLATDSALYRRHQKVQFQECKISRMQNLSSDISLGSSPAMALSTQSFAAIPSR